jgi:hypothetical protein
MENKDERKMILQLAFLLERHAGYLREIAEHWTALSQNNDAWPPFLAAMKEVTKAQNEMCDKLLKRSLRITH